MVQFRKSSNEQIFKVHPVVLAVASVLALVGCGSDDGGGGGDAKATTTLTGSYISGASVYCDVGRDGLFEGEESTTSSDGTDGLKLGEFQFQNECPKDNANIVAISNGAAQRYNEQSADPANLISGFSGQLTAPAGAAYISPLTTLLVAGVDETQIRALLGIPQDISLESIDLNTNPAVKAASGLVLQLATDMATFAGATFSDVIAQLATALSDADPTAPLITDSGVSDSDLSAIATQMATNLVVDASLLPLLDAVTANASKAFEAAESGDLAGLQSSANAASEVVSIGIEINRQLREAGLTGDELAASMTSMATTILDAVNSGSGVTADLVTDLKAAVPEGYKDIVDSAAHPYFVMNNVAVNDGAAVSLADFTNTGMTTGTSSKIDTLGFSLIEKGQPLGIRGKHVKVAMELAQGDENLKVALDDVLLYKDAKGMRIAYPLNAHMYGYYTNGTQSTSADLANINDDLLKTVVRTDGGTTFSQLSVQLGTMAGKFEDSTLVSSSPLIAGSATGVYIASFVIDGVDVQSNTGALSGKTVTIPNVDYTVSGKGVTGNVTFP